MEKFLAIIWLGIKYLYRYRRRYGFLAAAMIFCFAIVSFITSAKDGMYDSVYYSAQSHYTGDIVAVGYDSFSAQEFCHRLGRDEISAILKAADLRVSIRNTRCLGHFLVQIPLSILTA